MNRNRERRLSPAQQIEKLKRTIENPIRVPRLGQIGALSARTTDTLSTEDDRRTEADSYSA